MNAVVDISETILETERLILRAWKQEDLEAFFEYASVDGIGQMAGWPPHKSIEESQIILKRFIEGKRTFALVDKETGKVIGSLGLEDTKRRRIDKKFDELQGREIGYVLSKDYWGRGLMPEAVKRVIRYAFEEQGWDFLLCGHYSDNLQSRRVIEKCGFKHIEDTLFEGKESRLYLLER